MDVFDLFAKISLDTKGYDTGLATAKSKLSTFGSFMGSAFGTVAKVGAAALTAATGAVAGFAASSIEAGKDFDSSMSQVAATLGKTTKEINDLREFAQEMGRTTAFSATEAADALNYMALAGYDSEKSMAMLPNVLNLAAAGNMDLARASDMVTDTQTAFGLSLERTSQMVDEMAKAASTGNTSVEQLGDAFLVVGGLAKELNGGMITLEDGTTATVDGIQEMEIALTAMANAGVKGSEAGTHMRNMLLKLASPTAEGTKALEAMGVKVFDSEGKMRSLSDTFGDLNGKLSNMTQEKKIQTISKLFNTRDMAAAEAMLAAIGSDWDKIGESILDAEGASSKMAETQLDNLAGDITLFKSALEGAKIAVSDQLTPSLRNFVEFGTQGLSDLTGAFKEGGLSGAMETFGKILSDGLAMVISKIPEFIEAGLKLLSALGQGFADNVDVILDGISQVVTIILDSIADGLDGNAGDSAVIKFLKGLANIFIQNIGKLSDIGIKIITGIIGGLYNGVTKAAPQILNTGLKLLDMLTTGISEGLPKILPKVLDFLVSFSAKIRENAGTFIDAGIKLITTLAQGLIDGLPKMIQTIPTIISNIAGIINDNAPKLLVAGGKIILSLAQGIIKSIPVIIQELPKILQAIWDVFTAFNWAAMGKNIITMISNGLKSLGTGIPNTIKNILEGAVKTFKSINWKDFGKSIIQFITNGIKGAGSTFINILKDVGIKALTAFKNIDWLGSAKSLIKFLVDGLVSGVVEFGAGFVDAFLNLGQAVIDAIKEFFGIHSPSTVFAELGIMLIEGLIQGVLDMITGALDAIGQLGSAIVEGINNVLGPVWDDVKGWASDAWTTIKDTATEAWGKVEEGAGKLRDNVVSFFGEAKDKAVNAWNDAKSKFSTVWSNVKGAFSTVGTWFQTTFTTAKNWAVGAWSNVKSKFTTVWGNVKDAFSTAGEWFTTNFTTFKDNAVNAWNDIKSKFTTVWGNLKDAFNLEDATSWGTDLVKNFIGGIKEKAGELKEELKGVADKVKSFLGFSEPEEGPLSNFHTYAPDMMKLFAKGIKDNTYLVTDQIEKSFDFGTSISNGMTTGGFNAGGITINVYARDGQSARDIVDEIDYRIARKTEAKKAVWGMS